MRPILIIVGAVVLINIAINIVCGLLICVLNSCKAR